MRLLAPLVLFLAIAAPAQAVPAEVTFVTPDGLHSMRADGSERRLVAAGKTLAAPAWSPDGTRLAYNRGNRIYIGGRAITKPTGKDDGDASPVWSPDGRTLAFGRFIVRSESDLRTQIVLYDVAAGTERVFLEQRFDERFTAIGTPQFSPDGSRLAYTRSRLDTDAHFLADVLTVPVSGGPPTLLVRDAYSVAWSPDGTRLAYSSIKDKHGQTCGSDQCEWSPELYVSAADGSGAQRLTTNEGSDTGAVWSPDGTRILFSSDQNLPDTDASEIYSVAPDGSCMTWVTNGTPESHSPSFRPGSGDTFAPISCNPADQPLRPELPTPKPFAGGLWLGPRFEGLLASGTTRAGSVSYRDCEHFDPKRCPRTINLTSEPSCSTRSWRGMVEGGYAFSRRRGAVIAYYGTDAAGRLLSGAAITSIWHGAGRRGSLADVRRVVDALRPYTATTLEPLAAPRVPRSLARELDRTARLAKQAGRSAAAKRLKVPVATVTARLELRAVLRPYRLCDD